MQVMVIGRFMDTLVSRDNGRGPKYVEHKTHTCNQQLGCHVRVRYYDYREYMFVNYRVNFIISLAMQVESASPESPN